MPPELFWRVTPRVFASIMKGRHLAKVQAEKDRLSLAWHIENMSRHRRLPDLEGMLNKVGIAKLPDQSPEDMVRMLKSIDDGKNGMKFEFIPNPQ